MNFELLLCGLALTKQSEGVWVQHIHKSLSTGNDAFITTVELEANSLPYLMSESSSSSGIVHVPMRRSKRGDDTPEIAFCRRRCLLESFCTIALSSTMASSWGASPAYAGEVGAKINTAVTQSDLGLSVRRSVVRGAQVIDKVDGQWEKFSDTFGLGSERLKRDARPKPYTIPDPLPLEDDTARAILDAADSVFLSIVPISDKELKDHISKVDHLVRKSFERSNFSFDPSSQSMSAPMFNFLSYVHFRAFNDVLVERKINFGPFRSTFERKLGDRLLEILFPLVADASSKTGGTLKDKFSLSLAAIDNVVVASKSKGLIATGQRSEISDDKLDDWLEDLSDLQFSLAIDGDITLNAQILLQEQGFRLYPDFTRFAVTSALRRILGVLRQNVSSEEYYMDTDYNSDPDKFEVKQVLLNIVIESE